VSLPAGTYNFQGTRNGNSFTGNGSFAGPPAFNFTVSGTLSTSATAGSWQISGTIGGEQFTYTGAINVTTGGGGGGGGGNGSFAFSANSSNATTSALNGNVGVGTRTTLGGVTVLSATFASATSPTNLRNLTINLFKTGTFAVGDEFSLNDDNDSGVGGGTVLYGEGAPTNKAWISQSGTAKITALSGNNVTIQLVNARMQTAPIAGPGQTNQATGLFTLNGSGTVTIATPN
jgi:hypothetical protein